MLRFLLLSFLCTFASACAWGGTPPALLRADTAHLTLIAEVAVLVDKSGTETIDSVVPKESRFRPLSRVFSAGYTRDVHWFRVTVQRENSAARQWLLEVSPGYLDDVRLYTPDSENAGGYVERLSGDRLPFTGRERPHHNFVFNVDLPDNTLPYTVYLRVQTTSTTIAQFSLWAPDAFDNSNMGEYLVFGVLLGVLCLMLAYSIPQWFYLRERLYLLFVGQVLAMLIAFLGIDGIAAQFLLPLSPRLTDLLTSVGTCLLNFFGYWFFLDFLEVRQRHPRFAYPFYVVMALALLALPGPFLGYYVDFAPLMAGMSLCALPLCLVAAWRSVGEGMLGSRWVFLAYAWYCLVIGLNLLCVMGFIPGNSLFLQGWQYGAPIFVVFLQQAVLTRMRGIEQRHREALVLAAEAHARADTEQRQREAQEKFLSLVAHELKTPLAVIDSAVQALNYMPSEDPAVSSRHDRIRQSVARLNTLLEQALSAVRSEPEGVRLLTPRRELIAIDDLFASLAAVAALDTKIEVGQVETESCHADRHLLETALYNLFDNARKYGSAGNSVVLSAKRLVHNGISGVALQVASGYDGGLHDNCEAWFGKFWRDKARSNQEGVGLGLYLVRVIAEAHGGVAYCTIINDGESPQLVVSLWIPERAGSESA